MLLSDNLQSHCHSQPMLDLADAEWPLDGLGERDDDNCALPLYMESNRCQGHDMWSTAGFVVYTSAR